MQSYQGHIQFQRVVLRQTSDMVDYLLLTEIVHCSWYYATGAVVPYTVPFSLKLGVEARIHSIGNKVVLNLYYLNPAENGMGYLYGH